MTASNIRNGTFQTSENTIRILPRQGSETHEWIDVKFDDKGDRIASLSAHDDSDLPFYTLEPELLTVDAGLKTGQQETLTNLSAYSSRPGAGYSSYRRPKILQPQRS